MGTGIQICGLNGCGKSTIGRALARETGFYFIDNENLFFSRTDAHEPYANPRSRSEAEKLLMDEVSAHENFVFAAVRGDYGKDIASFYQWVVVAEAPLEIRLQRVRSRSFQKFGNRMLPGGELYESEEAFFRMIEARREDYVESWVKTLSCPVIRIDGTRPVEDNVRLILRQTGIKAQNDQEKP